MNRPDEREIIKIFQNRFGKKSRFRSNDLEIIKIGRTRFVTKSDMLVQSTDIPPKMKLREIARKSIVSCVSDFSCKGVKPRFATIALALPRNINQKMVNELADGFLQSSREFDLKIIGGDLNEGKEIVIEVSMFGLSKRAIPTRSGSKIGDVIVVSGPFGYCSAGLKIILGRYRSNSKFRNKCRQSVFAPSPRLEFGLKAAKYFSSSMDSSDGLSITLNEMSVQSKKQFVITNLPTRKDMIEFAQRNKINLEDLIFCGGEEYEIVATLSPNNLHKVRNIADKSKTPLQEIGYVSKGKNVIFAKKGGSRIVKKCGWTHLKS